MTHPLLSNFDSQYCQNEARGGYFVLLFLISVAAAVAAAAVVSACSSSTNIVWLFIALFYMIIIIMIRAMKSQTILVEEEHADTTAATAAAATATTADSLFAKALSNLSFNDRNTIGDEIHGVSCMAIKETPDLLKQSLIDFESEIHNITPKLAYDRAQELLLLMSMSIMSLSANNNNNNINNPSSLSSSSVYLNSNSTSTARSYSGTSSCYINENKFRLRFLRCELFDVRKAAERYIKYLEFVWDVYGEYALQRPIRMSDFTPKEMSFMREGDSQLLPYRDQSGRRIFAFLSDKPRDWGVGMKSFVSKKRIELV